MRVDDRLPMFYANLKAKADYALRDVSQDILIGARAKVPFRYGLLRNDSYNHRIGQGKWRVSFNKEYAIYQEKKQYRHYTTTGTGSRYLENAGDEMGKKIITRLKTQLGKI